MEKDRLQKENRKVTKENERLTKEIESLQQSYKKLNKMVLESFDQTMAGGKDEKIKRLNDTIASKEKLVNDTKAEIAKVKENYEKTLKQKSLEYELLKMDYQSIIVQNIQARQNNLKAEKNKNQKSEKSEKGGGDSRWEKSEISDASTKTNTKRPFNIVTNRTENTSTEERTGRRTRGGNKRNTTIRSMNEESENDENLFDDNNGDEEFEMDENDETMMEDDEDFEAEEIVIPKKGKRKARESKKKPPQTKRVKKNENKDLLMVNRNTIQYHLFN